MSTIAVLLMSARTEATLIIISLLLVSAIIGYVTAWLYFRFIHKGEVEALESTVEKLRKDNARLEKRLEDKTSEIDQLKAEIKILKDLNAKAENEIGRASCWETV